MNIQNNGSPYINIPFQPIEAIQVNDVNAIDQYGFSKLMNASLLEDQEQIEELCSDPDIDINYFHPESGKTALMMAAEKGWSEIVETLLSHPSINASILDTSGNNIIHLVMHGIQESFPASTPHLSGDDDDFEDWHQVGTPGFTHEFEETLEKLLAFFDAHGIAQPPIAD